MSINEVRYLPECGSTNAYVKEHFEEFGPVAAVYTENQTAGRGRLGRSWVNAEGKALYYTVAIKEPLAQPATLPLLASLAVRRQLQLRYGVDCQIKWPNDLLLNGKKIVGILCESVSYGYQQQGRGILCGIGINLAQPQSYFDAADLPHGTSLTLQGAAVDLATDPAWLAEGLTDFGFDRNLYTFARDGFAPFREEYKAACINLGRRVTFDLPDGGQGLYFLPYLLRFIWRRRWLRVSPPPQRRVTKPSAHKIKIRAQSSSRVALLSVRKSDTYSRWVTRSTCPTS